jgi:BTB/POZ domain-containing protein 1/2
MEESARENHFERRAISLEDNSREDVFLVSEAKTEDTEEMPEESLQTRFARLLSCEDMADVHFLVGGAQRHQRQLRVPAHRLVLAVASPVFRRMFFGAEDESVSLDNCSAEDVVLEDLEPLVFLEFLRFLYTDQIRLQKDNAVAVLYAAKKYEIPFLERLCFRFVNFEISKDNALLIWLSAKTFREPEVESLALRVIRRFAADVLLAPDFVRADHHSVCQLLEDDLLRVQEVDLFLAVTRWAKHQCLRRGQCPTRVHIRHVMAEAVDLIRFPLMTSEQLRTVVQSEGVLEDDVLRALSANQRSWPRKALHFSSTPRAYQRLRGPLLCVQRFASFDNQMAVRAGQRSLRFAANKRIFVAGVGVYGPRRPFHFQLQVSPSRGQCVVSLSLGRRSRWRSCAATVARRRQSWTARANRCA